MGDYTVYEDKQVDAYITKSLSRITENILGLIDPKCIKSIILTGSFGRGEGGVCVTGGQIGIVNDFDITIIPYPRDYNKVIRLYEQKVERLAIRLANELNIKQIDLGIAHPGRYMFMTNTVNFYEVSNACKVLYGNFRIKRKLDPKKLTMLDGAMFFLTRGSGLLIPPILFAKYNKPDQLHRETILIEINKGKLAMGDAFLLLKRQYHYSFRERILRAERISFHPAPGDGTVKKMYLEALRWKIKPDLAWNGVEEAKAEWNRVREIFSEFFLWYENLRLEKSFENWTEYMENIYRNQRDFGNVKLKRMLKGIFMNPARMLHGSHWSNIMRKSFPAKLSIMPGLLFFRPDRDDQGLLMESRRNFQRFYHYDNGQEWIELAARYLEIFHPGGPAGLITRGKKIR